ncbi:MAG: hypothetical protein M1835_007719 [Candelina submexicana]|nr:MAG: hypothetical protein M1835_007719 [Candelina submexicana]
MSMSQPGPISFIQLETDKDPFILNNERTFKQQSLFNPNNLRQHAAPSRSSSKSAVIQSSPNPSIPTQFPEAGLEEKTELRYNQTDIGKEVLRQCEASAASGPCQSGSDVMLPASPSTFKNYRPVSNPSYCLPCYDAEKAAIMKRYCDGVQWLYGAMWYWRSRFDIWGEPEAAEMVKWGGVAHLACESKFRTEMDRLERMLHGEFS